MNYVLTGSTGHITRPLAIRLLAAGHKVVIVSSNPDRKQAIEELGAEARIGSVEDPQFVKEAFAGADAVYLMIPPKWSVTDWLGYQKAVSNHFIEAIQANGISHVLLLSSIGAHMGTGAGPIDGLAYLETQLKNLDTVHTRVLRPSYFFYNILSMAGMAKHMGFIGSAQPAGHRMVLADTDDIAEAAFEELNGRTFQGFSIRYVASDERSWAEIAAVLGAAIGKPDLAYVEFSDEQSRQGMMQMNLAPAIVEGYVTLGQALRSGEMEADYKAHPPQKPGKVKLEDFARAFAQAYQNA